MLIWRGASRRVNRLEVTSRSIRRAGRWGALACFVASAGLAAERPRVVIEGPLDNRIVVQLAGELQASGFQVRTKLAEGGAGRPPSEAFENADALIRVSAEMVEVWSVASPSAIATHAEVVHVAGTDDASAAVAALRAEEIVRARLLPVARAIAPTATAPAPPLPDVTPAQVPSPISPAGVQPAASSDSTKAATPPPPAARSSEATTAAPVVAVARPNTAHFGLDAGGLVFLSPGGVSPAVDVLLMPRWMPVAQASVRAVFTLPLTSPTVTSSEGEASVREWFFGASAAWNLIPAESPWAASVGAGTGAVRVQTQGIANAPYKSSSGDAWAWFSFVSAGASRRLGSQTRLGVDLLGGASVPEIAVAFPSRQQATWGRPLAAVSLTLQIDAL